jgi:hypothetical protein
MLVVFENHECFPTEIHNFDIVLIVLKYNCQSLNRLHMFLQSQLAQSKINMTFLVNLINISLIYNLGLCSLLSLVLYFFVLLDLLASCIFIFFILYAELFRELREGVQYFLELIFSLFIILFKIEVLAFFLVSRMS